MTTIWKWLLAGGLLAVFAVVAIVVTVGRYDGTGLLAHERREREAVIQPLLQSHAPRERVVQALGLEFVDYSVGSTNRWVIAQRVSNPKVRQLAERYPGLLFHTTMDTMTWLFFDSEGTLQDYYVCAQ